ncbi:RepB family DNA primase [Granulicella paludicola]|uniref:RepB family DNA primase n=1 Tax=Granulicella paludicola TaxID=474951 RepID=UPI0021E037F1|nr:RepB family DNA primase [Granulicella paludicola]
MNFEVAREFLTRSFHPQETIAVLQRREAPTKVTQRIVSLETVLTYRYLAWLSHQNADGMNIYVGANPLRPGSRKRTKESIACVRHLYLDIDADGEARLGELLDSDSVPTPNVVLSTSPNKYQVLWCVDGFDFETQESTLKQLSVAFGGDPACTDCNRVLRIPGFVNCKYTPQHVVSAQYPSSKVWTSADFRLAEVEPIAERTPASISVRRAPSKGSSSENDWAWVCGQLKNGAEAMQLTRDLASRRSDKPNPLYYAQRTVDVASAKLWVIGGIPSEDIVTMLQFRRELEIPARTCASRAREITDTALRMLGRRKIA